MDFDKLFERFDGFLGKLMLRGGLLGATACVAPMWCGYLILIPLFLLFIFMNAIAFYPVNDGFREFGN